MASSLHKQHLTENETSCWWKITQRETGTGQEKYYSYNMLLYFDNILSIQDNVDLVFKQLHENFPLEPRIVGEPEIYLGENMTLTAWELYVGTGPMPIQVWQWTLKKYFKYMGDFIQALNNHSS